MQKYYTRALSIEELIALPDEQIDTDVLAWLQSAGAGYQTRLNQLLRDAMLKTLKRQSSEQHVV
jgi:uncharacterized protein (DUF4415 family)